MSEIMDIILFYSQTVFSTILADTGVTTHEYLISSSNVNGDS
jgi:hypothetical protein